MTDQEFEKWLDDNYESEWDEYVKIWKPLYDDPNDINTDDFEVWARHQWFWNQECVFCKSKKIILVEYGGGYDGISEIRCSDCKKRAGRWSGKELIGNDMEPPFGIWR